MLSINANLAAKLADKTGIEPVTLMVFNFSTPVYLSDRDVTPSGGQAHSGLVSSWGFIDASIARSGIDILGTMEHTDLRVTIVNCTSPRFSDYFADEPPETVTVDLYQWEASLADADKKKIYSGTVRGYPTYDESSCVVTISGIWSAYNKIIGENKIVTTDDYPGADPSVVGKMLPIPFGTCRQVPFYALDAGWRSPLSEAILATGSVSTISVSDAAGFADSGVVQIGDEQFSYTGKTADTLTGCSRAYGGTSMAAHEAADVVWQIQDEYIYAIGCEVTSFGGIYIDGVKQASLTNINTYTGLPPTNAHPSGDYDNLAVISFDADPLLTRQFNESQVSVEVTQQPEAEITQQPEYTFNVQSTPWLPDSYSDGGTGYVTNPTYAYDGNDSSYATLYNATFDTLFTLVFDGTAEGIPTMHMWEVTYECFGPGACAVSTSDADSLGSLGASTSGTQTFYFEDTDYTADNWNMGIRFSCPYGTTVYIYEVRKMVTYDYEQEPSTDAVAAITQDVELGVSNSYAQSAASCTARIVVGGTVAADLVGAIDNALGDVTGTMHAEITNASHVMEKLLRSYVGLPAALIDTDMFDDAATWYAGTGYLCNWVWDAPGLASEILTELAMHCRARLVVTPAGVVRIIIRGVTSTDSPVEFDSTNIQYGSFSVSRTSHDGLFNRVKYAYDRDNARAGEALEDYNSIGEINASESQTTYGVVPYSGKESLFFFPEWTDKSIAWEIADYYVDSYSVIRKIITFTTFLDALAIEPGDQIVVSHSVDDIDDQRFDVLQTVITPGGRTKIDTMKITAIELLSEFNPINTYLLTDDGAYLTTDGGSYLYGE